MIKRFIEHCIKAKLFDSARRLIIAVSGGADSLALADMLFRSRQRFKLELIVAHYEHGLRGAESVADAEFVERVASERGLDCVIEHGDVPAYARDNKQSLETAARNLRHEFLERVRVRLDCDAIALAHHADDQAETILMRLIRGTGATGLSAMSAKSGRLLRPLLSFRKRELEEYCRTWELQPRIDATNFETNATRNKIRLELLPVLEEYNPSIVETLCRLGETVAEDVSFIKNYAREIYLSTAAEKSGKIRLSQSLVRAEPAAIQRELIRMFLADALGSLEGLEFHHIEGVRRVIVEGLAGVELPGHIRVTLKKHFITVERTG